MIRLCSSGIEILRYEVNVIQLNFLRSSLCSSQSEMPFAAVLHPQTVSETEFTGVYVQINIHIAL